MDSSYKLATLSLSPTWMAGALALGPSTTIPIGTLVGSWVRVCHLGMEQVLLYEMLVLQTVIQITDTEQATHNISLSVIYCSLTSHIPSKVPKENK